MARQLGRLGAQASARRAGAGRWGETRARGALRHGRLALTIRPWRPATRAGQGAQGRGARRSRHGSQGRERGAATLQLGLRYGRGLGHDTARPAHDTAGRARAWACLLGLLGACASGLVFRTGFRLSDIFESPFGPGSWTLFMNTVHHKNFQILKKN